MTFNEHDGCMSTGLSVSTNSLATPTRCTGFWPYKASTRTATCFRNELARSGRAPHFHRR